MKKFIIFAAVAFVLCVPALADNYSFDNSATFYSGATSCELTSNNSNNVYFCFLSFDSSSSYVALSVDSDAVFIEDFGGRQYDRTCSVLDNDSGIYYRLSGISNANSLSDNVTTFPVGTSISAVCGYFVDYIGSSGGSGSMPTSFTVPRGNVLYFQVATNSDVNFVSHFTENSGLFSSSNVYGPWGDTYQRISTESTLPSSGIEFPRSGSDAIVWGKGEPLNVLGQTKVGVFTKSCNTGTYYAFYNPAYQSISSSDGFGSASVGSNVTVSGNFSFIRVYSLQQILDISTSTDSYDTYYVGTPDGDGGVTWVDQDDQVNYPSSGGDNQEDEPISSVSLIESIKRILRNILSEIESIFTFGFSAIRDLVDLMDEFVATFDDLYEWLPEECYTLLIACVSVAIAIGVFKVFL